MPGTYRLELAVNATASVTTLGGGGAQASVCNTLYGWTNALGVGCISPNGLPSPYSGANCQANAGTAANGQCYFIQWESTGYTITNHFPTDPVNYNVSVDGPSVFNVASGISGTTVSTTVSVTGYSGFSTVSPPCVFLAGSDLSLLTAFWFTQGSVKQAGFCVQFSNANGVANSYTLSMQTAPCAAYNDIIAVVANYGPVQEVIYVWLFVTSNCSHSLTLNTHQVSMNLTSSGSSLTATVGAITGDTATAPVFLYTRYQNYTYTLFGKSQAQTCYTQSTCPWVGIVNSTSPTGFSDPYLLNVPAGGSASATVTTKPQSGTAANLYLLVIFTFDQLQTTTVITDCSASATSWVCFLITTKANWLLFGSDYLTVTIPQLTMSFGTNALSTTPGGGTSTTVTVSSANGWGGSVVLWAGQRPSGWGVYFGSLNTPDSCFGKYTTTCNTSIGSSSSSTLYILFNATSTASTGTANINIYGNFPTQNSTLTATVTSSIGTGGGGGPCCPHPNSPTTTTTSSTSTSSTSFLQSGTSSQTVPPPNKVTSGVKSSAATTVTHVS